MLFRSACFRLDPPCQELRGRLFWLLHTPCQIGVCVGPPIGALEVLSEHLLQVSPTLASSRLGGGGGERERFLFLLGGGGSARFPPLLGGLWFPRLPPSFLLGGGGGKSSWLRPVLEPSSSRLLGGGDLRGSLALSLSLPPWLVEPDGSSGPPVVAPL